MSGYEKIKALKNQVVEGDGMVRIPNRHFAGLALPEDTLSVICDNTFALVNTVSQQCLAVGDNYFRHLGIGSNEASVDQLTPVAGLQGRVINCARGFFLTNDGELYTAGRTYFGSSSKAIEPTKISILSNIQQLSARERIALVLDDAGRVFSDVKSNASSAGRQVDVLPPEAGLGTGRISSGFEQVTQISSGDMLPPIQKIETGLDSAFMLSTLGDVYCFGMASYTTHSSPGRFYMHVGKLPRKLIIPLEPGDKVVDLIVSKYDAYVLTQQGKMHCVFTPYTRPWTVNDFANRTIKHAAIEHEDNDNQYMVITTSENVAYIQGRYTYSDGRVGAFKEWTPLKEAGLKNVFEYIREASELLASGAIKPFEEYMLSIPKRYMLVIREEAVFKPFFAYIDGIVKLESSSCEPTAVYRTWLDEIPLDSVYAKVVAPRLLEVLYAEYISSIDDERRDEAHFLIVQYSKASNNYSRLLMMALPNQVCCSAIRNPIDTKAKLRMASLYLRSSGSAARPFSLVRDLSRESEEFAFLEKEEEPTKTAESTLTSRDVASLLFYSSSSESAAGAGAGVPAQAST